MKNKLKSVVEWISKYKFTIITYILLIVVSNVLRVNILHLLTVLSFMSLLMFFAKTKYSIPFFILFALLIAADIFFALFFQDRLNVGLIASAMDTNPGEMQGAMKNMLYYGVPVLIGTFALLYLSIRELRTSKLSRGIALSLFAGYWLLFVPIYCTYLVTQREYWEDEMKLSKLFTIYYATGHKFPVIYNDLLVAGLYFDSKDDFSAYTHADREIPEGIYNDGLERYTPNKIYMIIGESARRDHMSAYGYDKKTTPFLDSLMISDTIGVKKFNGISSATLTREVMRLALSFAVPRNYNYFNKSKNLVELVKDKGYTTYWISNQPRIGFHETSVSVLSATADYSYHEKKYPMEDLELVDRVKNELKKGEKQFFALHLDGSHIWYPDKYDEIDEKSIQGSDNDVLHYDRTIHHTDRVLEKLYEMAEQDGSDYIILYFSDHGEIIGKGHGFRAEDTGNIDIPFVTINNSKTAVDSIVSHYIDSELDVINNTNIINIVSEFAGYRVTDQFIKNAVKEGKYVHFPDMTVVEYKDLLKPQK